MSKIEEMACQYGNNIESNYNIDMFDRGDIMNAYEDGAKAVLGEIEKALPFSIRYGYANEKIVEVIKELKGYGNN